MDVLSNSIGLLSALLGHRVPGGWWMDPCGAIAIALYTIINWSRTVVENAGTVTLAIPSCVLRLAWLQVLGSSVKEARSDLLLCSPAVPCDHCCPLKRGIELFALLADEQ